MIIFLFTLVTASFPEEDHVMVLTKDNFYDAIETIDKLLVEFYAPWCDHCKQFAPEYVKAAEILKKKKIRVAKIDGSENREIVDKYNVKGYPSLIYFVEGNPTDYTGVRTADGVVDWMTERQKKKIFKVEESGGFEIVMQKKGPFAVFYGKISDSERSVYEFAALNVKDFEFFESDKESDAVLAGVTVPRIVVYLDGEKFEYEGNVSTLDLVKFMEKFKPAKVHRFNDQTAKMIFDYQSTTFFFLSDSETATSNSVLLKRLANEYKQTFIFTFCDLNSKPNGAKLSDALGILSSSQPIAVIVDFQDAFNKYKTIDISPEGIEGFIKSYINKELTPYYKSQPEDTPESDNGVRIITGINYESIVMDPSKVVVVLYYTPEHPKCLEFLPKYERLAKETRRWKDLVVGKFDLSKNEVKGLKIKMIPAVKIFPKDNKEGLIYGGQMIKSDLKDNLRQYVEPNQDL